MYEASYYREQADRAQRLSARTTDPEMRDALVSTARDFNEIAEDLERGTIEIRHSERMPQNSNQQRAE
jgi:hypothetical protein